MLYDIQDANRFSCASVHILTILIQTLFKRIQ
jgi:hypothetical protein